MLRQMLMAKTVEFQMLKSLQLHNTASNIVILFNR